MRTSDPDLHNRQKTILFCLDGEKLGGKQKASQFLHRFATNCSKLEVCVSRRVSEAISLCRCFRGTEWSSPAGILRKCHLMIFTRTMFAIWFVPVKMVFLLKSVVMRFFYITEKCFILSSIQTTWCINARKVIQHFASYFTSTWKKPRQRWIKPLSHNWRNLSNVGVSTSSTSILLQFWCFCWIIRRNTATVFFFWSTRKMKALKWENQFVFKSANKWRYCHKGSEFGKLACRAQFICWVWTQVFQVCFKEWPQPASQLAWMDNVWLGLNCVQD